MTRKGFMMVAVVFLCMLSGCGREVPTIVNEPVEIVETPPVQEEINLETKEKESEIINMVKAEPTKAPEPKLKTIGTMQDGAIVIRMINHTGGEITQVYLRSSETEDWGWNRAEEGFTWKDGETIQFCVPGSEVSEFSYYDLSMIFKDQTPTEESWFRLLPLYSMEEIVFRFREVQGVQVPYAEYKQKGVSGTINTYKDVLSRLGMSDVMVSYDFSYNDVTDDQEENQEAEEPSQEDASPSELVFNPSVNGTDGQNSQADGASGSALRQEAATYIGMDVNDLLDNSNLGVPNDTSYSVDSDMGEGGYYYFDGFTVITSIDQDGNETVSQIW